MSQTRMQALQIIGTALADASSAATTQMAGTSTVAGTCTTKSTRPQLMPAAARVDIVTTRPFTANTSEGDKAYYVHVEVPGVSAGDLSVSVESDRVVVKSDSHDWRTAVSVPDGVERDKISANFDDGLLRIVMPKTADTARREITIRTGSDGTPADG
ncbi:Hsp20/alpha crystallin family protein [Ramlibacter ginsenosidimutans]|uniref:Hsp20/alpha crystallin family protein n=1 Tax=Ramlibacter ginsenosidimutans TaxID=502333 RepID=A0A934TVU6_9BURK|nr:Hsp20/alpha crystallin family protein [Ramlibacter ginsenosidimutans]MBK6007657.1 Hsp20/alpha crystallin family protein [Ramlibacter ginsenosidimutans]